ncbi:cobalt ECF transporter T component CbiQ [candidate division KSB1 bacterium]
MPGTGITSFSLFDIRLKLVFLLIFVLLVAVTSEFTVPEFSLFFSILLLWGLFSRPDPKTLLTRIALIFPFLTIITLPAMFFTGGNTIGALPLFFTELTITGAGLAKFLTLMLKALLSIGVVVVFSTAESKTTILRGLERLHFPKLLIHILFIALRYIQIIGGELRTMLRARDARSFDLPLRQFYATSGALAGSLFIRSLRRSQHVYNAMLARGYSGANFPVPFNQTNNEVKRSQAIMANIYGGILFFLLGALLLLKIAYAS